MAYQIQIFKKNWTTQRGTDGKRARTLTHATDISVRQDLNAPGQITFRVPRGSDDAKALEIGYVVRVMNGKTLVASGIVTGPLDKTRPMIPVTVAGKAEILNWAITPYEFQLQGDTAEAQVRELLKNYRFFRTNTPAAFNAGTLTDTEVLTVAGDPDEYFVTLKETNEVYNASGTYISQPILCTDDTFGDPDDITRLRYLSELGNNTAITVAFRHSNDAATGTPSNWSAWSSEYDLTTENTEKLGLTGQSIRANFRWIQVRFSLSTSDTSISPALQAFEIICEYPSEITAGSIRLSGPKLNKTFSFASHHQAIREIVAARNAEFRVTDDYKLDIAERFGAKNPTQTFEVGKNCNVAQFQQQDRRLSTEIWSLGEGKGIAQQLLSVDASDTAIEKYGTRPWVYRPHATTETQRRKEIADELARRDTPTLHVTLDELATTRFSAYIGDNVNFQYSRRNINTTLRVIGIRAADPRKGQPRQFILESNEGFFFTEPEPETQDVAATGVSGKDGRDAPVPWGDVGIDNICYSDDSGVGPILPVTATISIVWYNRGYKVFVRDAADQDIVQLSIISNRLTWLNANGNYEITWDGRDAQGNFVETGKYTFVVLRRGAAIDQFGRERDPTIYAEYPVTLRRGEFVGNIPRSYKFEDTVVQLFDLTATEIEILKILEAGDTIGFFDDGTEHARGTFESASLPECENIQPDKNAAQLRLAWILPPKVPFGQACSIRTTRILQINTEEIFAVSTDEVIPNSQLPDNKWGYDLGGTQDELTWHTTPQSVSKEKPYLFVATREFLSMPEKGDETCDKWSPPALIARYPEDGSGTEEIFATTTDEIIPGTQLPDNDWGYDAPGTQGGLTWHTTVQSVSKEKPNLFVSTRDILGTPAKGDDVDDDWSPPALIGRYGRDGATGKPGTDLSHLIGTGITGATVRGRTIDPKVLVGTGITGATVRGKTVSAVTGTGITGATVRGRTINPKVLVGTGITGATTYGEVVEAAPGTGITGATVKGKTIDPDVLVGTGITGTTVRGKTVTAAPGTGITGATVKGRTIDPEVLVGTGITGATVKGRVVNVTPEVLVGTGITGATVKGRTIDPDDLVGTGITGATVKGRTIDPKVLVGTGITGATAKGPTGRAAPGADGTLNFGHISQFFQESDDDSEDLVSLDIDTKKKKIRVDSSLINSSLSTVSSRASANSTAISTASKNTSTAISKANANATAITTVSKNASTGRSTLAASISTVSKNASTGRSTISKNASTALSRTAAFSRSLSTALSRGTANAKAITTVSKNASTGRSTLAASISTVSKNALTGRSTLSKNISTAISKGNANATAISTVSKNASTGRSTISKNVSTSLSTANSKIGAISTHLGKQVSRINNLSRGLSATNRNAGSALTSASGLSRKLLSTNVVVGKVSTAASNASKNASTALRTANGASTSISLLNRDFNSSLKTNSSGRSTVSKNASTSISTANSKIAVLSSRLASLISRVT